MASEDVIELGSSDDETEPAPKKSKPMPNAMVCIPRKLHEVTIKPAKLNLAVADRGSKAMKVQLQPAKGVSTLKGVPTVQGMNVTKGLPVAKRVLTTREQSLVKGVPMAIKRITGPKGSSIINPFATKSKTNGKPTQKVVMKPPLLNGKPLKNHKPIMPHTNVNFSKVSNLPNIGIVSSSVLKNPIKIQNKSLSNLPPSITVRRTASSNHKPILFIKAANVVKSKSNIKPITEVPTVELDDDESSPSTSSPAWYLRPEEQTDTLEQKNNTEPEPPNMIEITIEDSPIKPAQTKRACEVGAELAITIDDSPVKATLGKNSPFSGSDDETECNTVPNSKKKLEYPKETDNDNRKTVEIEIEIDIPLEESLNTIKERNDDYQEVSVEKAPEPNKKHDGTEKITQKFENSTIPTEKDIEVPSTSKLIPSVKSEFHSVYQNFIDVCFQLENSEDMTKIVDKKIKAYYRQVPKEYTESEEFIDMVASKILAMKASPEKMYLYIKDIVDELNMQRKIAKSQIVNIVTKTEEPEDFLFGEESEYDSKRQRQIRKLEKTIKKLHRAIQKLEEQEVDFDDDDDSVYLLTERYKERMVRVYAKFCQLTNTKMPSEPRILLDARPGQPSGPAKRLERWINKKVPIGTPLPFPDFHDVLRCVREANDEDKLCWNEVDIMEEARDLFMRCGKKLQRRRQENEWRLAASRISLDIDPAENNEQLKCKLEENKKLAANKETEIFNKYADRQNQLKLEGVEIGDKEAEESPVESEEEEAHDESVSLENKCKRKERLKRLLQEISKGNSEEKENQSSIKSEVETDAKIPEDNQKVVITKHTMLNKEDSEKNSEKSENHDKDSQNAAETLSVSSDDSNALESDVDELHLLQKLHSGDEVQTSTLESSDSGSPIAISDSLESDSDNKKDLSDVISIENSSYSESEADKVDNITTKNADSIQTVTVQPDVQSQPIETEALATVSVETACSNNVIESSCPNEVIEAECSTPDIKNGNNKSNNDENSESVENILLASSDEETGGYQEEELPSARGTCINLRDDFISIDETVIGSVGIPEKDIKPESSVIIPNKETNADQPNVKELTGNIDSLKDEDKLDEKLKNNESTDTSRNKASIASNEGSTLIDICIVPDDTNPADPVIYMNVDQEDTELETISNIEENVPPILSSEIQ